MSAEVRRREALRVVQAVSKGASLEGELAAARRRLPPDVEPGFLVELVRGALQWQTRYDHLIIHFSRRHATPDPVVRTVLHLALHQLVGMPNVPAYAAIHQAGELCRAVHRSRATGYVNGLLQSCARALAARPGDVESALRPLYPDPTVDPAGHLATWYSHPRWLVERWLGRFGFVACEALLAHANVLPPVCLHVLAPHEPETALAALAEAGIAATPGTHHPRALVLAERPDRTTLLRALAATPGLIVQDEGAQLATAWLADDVHAPLLDLCAAPGGKTFHLASLLPADALVVAHDLRPRRLSLVCETATRLLEPRLRALAGDGTRPAVRPEAFATVLVDGPCSGTGVIRHHPEGRWRLRSGTLERNAERLRDLVLAAADLVAPGGTLYYATCSLEPEENEDVVDAVMASRGDLAWAPANDGASQHLWLPHETHTDGFYAARLRRRDGSA